jgi:hypothetical protein
MANGYAAGAEFMTRDPDNESYVFRRFDKLTARNLMHLQGELLALQSELDGLDSDAASSPDPDLHVSLRSWQAMKQNSKDTLVRSGEEERKRLATAKELQAKLKGYRKLV